MAAIKNPAQLFPMFITSKLEQTRAFYLKAGFNVRVDMPEYLQVFYEDGMDLCFMTPHTAENGKEYASFAGKGVVVSIPTKNADQKAAELQKCDVPIVNEVADKPWGWRSFHVADPNGVILDFFHVYKQAPAENEQS